MTKHVPLDCLCTVGCRLFVGPLLMPHSLLGVVINRIIRIRQRSWLDGFRDRCCRHRGLPVCVVLKQIEATLTKARKSVRCSITALDAIESIIQQCRLVFKEIEDILDGLRKSNNEPTFLARVAWTLKKSKVQLLRKTLESSKFTLSCMLMALLFAENLASRRQVLHPDLLNC